MRNRFVPGSMRVFDLANDPGEHAPIDLADPAHRDVVAGLLRRLDAYEASQPSVASLPVGRLDLEMARQLAGLGYTAGLSDEALAALTSGADERAIQLLQDTSLLGSNEVLEESLYERPIRWPPPGDAGDG